MDLKALREMALAETARYFSAKPGTAPAEDSDEWEAEYRRQFDRLKKSAAPTPPAARSDAALVDERPDVLPKLSGTPADQRYAFAIRAARLKQLRNAEVRDWMARTWTASSDWIETRELSEEALLRRAMPRFAEDRQRTSVEAAANAAAERAKAEAAASLRQQLKAAGVSAAGLVELIDVCSRADAAPLKAKLAEIHVEGRTLRVFETAHPAILMVLEKRGDHRSEYGIERDDGLVSDLTLFARAAL